MLMLPTFSEMWMPVCDSRNIVFVELLGNYPKYAYYICAVLTSNGHVEVIL